jgi:ethanolamine utilization microcompartment shell protein EutL
MQLDVIEELANIGAIGDESDDAQLTAADEA